MNNKQNTNNHIQLKYSPNLFSLCASLSFILSLSACCSSQTRQNSAITILKEQNELIQKLQTERDDEMIQKKIDSDVTLKKAEDHLKISIQALKMSNETVIQTMSNKEDKGEQK
jgi:hypothetical protein